ncbi:MAG: hypothetical protein ACRDRH_10530 [Pseudonocardia sp.]
MGSRGDRTSTGSRAPSPPAVTPISASPTCAGPPRGVPVLIIPGGPGLAPVLLYRMLRRMATARNLPVIMVEHR